MLLRGHVFSRTLSMETGISVLIPSKPVPDRPYDVVYLLHGLCGRSGDWLDYTLLATFARACGAIIVMPEVARSFYADQAIGLKYFTYIADELPDICADVFNITADREHTAVIGASMGGYGALRVALLRPQRFGRCGALSSACLYIDEGLPVLRADPQAAKAMFGEQLVTDLAAVFGPDYTWDESYGVRALAERIVDAPLRPDIYMACGSDDSLIDENRRFRDDMAGLGYPVTFAQWGGGHDWTFFNQALEKALVFCLDQAG